MRKWIKENKNKCSKQHGGGHVDIVYSDQIPEGCSFEVNGVLVIGTKKDLIKEAG